MGVFKDTLNGRRLRGRCAGRWSARVEPDAGGTFPLPGCIDRLGYDRIVEVRDSI
jgi:hypothetical protein